MMSDQDKSAEDEALHWSSRWLRGVPCTPPCWEGITLGETTREEAAEKLKQNPIIKPETVEVYNHPEKVGVRRTARTGSTERMVGVNWRYLPTGGRAFASADLRDIIHTIHPQFPENYKLGEIIGAYGNPAFVHGKSFMAFCGTNITQDIRWYGDLYTVSFYWDKQGIEIESAYSSRTKPVINENLTVKLVKFVLPAYLFPSLDSWIVWKGWQSFDDYWAYREQDDPLFND